MKITQSTLALHSLHASTSQRTQQTSMRAWMGSQRPDFAGQQRNAAGGDGVNLSLSRAALAQLRMSVASARQTASAQTEAVNEANQAVSNDPRLRLLIDMVEALTGRKIRVFDASQLQSTASQVGAPNLPAAASANAPAAALGWGLEVDSQTRLTEHEFTQVSAQGVVNTADGQQISFSMQLQMSRAFEQETNLSIRQGDAVRKDPLVINFNGGAAQLTDASFAFDLDADGQQENIAFVSGGSGFLALDKNQDGQINNGSELFGPRSGDGFADLAQYDQDGNQWIDENDAVFSQLQVWQRDASGQSKLSTLAQSGVGALYLGRVASAFSVNTPANQTLGQVRSTGVFLYESGTPGTLQQVDL